MAVLFVVHIYRLLVLPFVHAYRQAIAYDIAYACQVIYQQAHLVLRERQYKAHVRRLRYLQAAVRGINVTR